MHSVAHTKMRSELKLKNRNENYLRFARIGIGDVFLSKKG